MLPNASSLLKTAGTALAAFAIVFVPCESQAGLFRLESETLTSARNGDDQAFEIPAYEFLSSNYQSLSRDLEVNADLSLYGDAARSRNAFKLHLLDVSYAVVPDLITLTMGRSFETQRSIRTNTVDVAGIDLYLLDKQLKAGAFAGKEQRLEFRQWTPISNISGAYLSYTSSSLFPLFSKLKFQHRQYDRATSESENLVQASLHKPFSGALSPELMLDGELNTGTRHLNRVETELALYPDYATSLRAVLQTYELKLEDGIEQPIFSIFSQGRLYEASLQAERQFGAQWVGSISLAYDNYVIQSPKRTDGFKIESDLRYSLQYASFSWAVYTLHSYGGDILGGRIAMIQKLSDRSQLNEAVDLASYSKVTSSKRSALNSQIGFENALSNNLKLSIGGEFNSNNNLKYDIRGVMKLTYLLWTET